MEVIVIDSVAWEQLKNDLSAMVHSAVKDAAKAAADLAHPINDWVSAHQAQALLGISSNHKLTKLRDSGEIAFTQHGRIYRYSKKSIHAFHERNMVNAFPIRARRASRL